MPSNNINNIDDNTDNIKEAILELQNIIDKTYKAVGDNKFENIPELLGIHKKVMDALNRWFTNAKTEHKEILLETSDKTNSLIDLIQLKSKDIKKQLMANGKRKKIKNAYLQN